MPKPFNTYISQSSLEFCPGGDPTKFWVAVQNNSPDYASFKFDLTSAGDNNISSPDWYRMLSADSYTIPPQDCVKFEVEILKLPPGREGFVGMLSLRANIYSPETDCLEHQTLKLQAAGIPPVIRFVASHIQAVPESEVAIALEITNPNDQPISMKLGLTGQPKEWLRESPTNLILKPKATQIKTFNCYIPTAAEAPEGQYPFSAEVRQSGTKTTSETALLEIIPTGHIDLQCDPPHQTLPTQPGRWFNQHHKPATFPLTWTNHSNMTVRGHLTVAPTPERPKWRQWLQPERFEPLPTDMSLPIGSCSRSPVTIDYQPPWLGWGRYQKFEIQDIHTEPAVEVQNHTPVLSLKLLPLIPRWIQGLGILGGLVFIWLLLFQGHRATINHAEFAHVSTSKETSLEPPYRTVSGAENATLLSWKFPTYLSWLARPNSVSTEQNKNKAISVVRYRPPNTNQVAVGFKNGEIKLYDWQSKTEGDSLIVTQKNLCQDNPDKPEDTKPYDSDRVYDLVFSEDGQFLYSAHGSGRILKWDLTKGNNSVICLQGIQNNTVTAITLVEQNGKSFLVAGGRRNHLELLDINKKNDEPVQTLLPVMNPTIPVRSYDHIVTVDSPAEWPSIVVAGNDQGTITLLDINNCSSTNCPKESWQQAHGETAVRSVSFSEDGCYLSSAGDDGQVKLWPMNDLNNIEENNNAIKQDYILRQSRRRFSWHPFQLRPVNTVDLLKTSKKLFIVSGGKDQQLRRQHKSISDLNKYFSDHNCQSPQ